MRLCITLATAIYLAFASRAALSFLVTSANPKYGRVTIEVSRDQTMKAAGSQSGLSMDSLIVDGSLLRWDSTDHTIGWEVRPNGELPASLFDSAPERAVLTFRAERFIALVRPVEWSGTIRVERNGKVVLTRNVDRGEAQQHPIALEDSVAPQSTAVFVGALILFAGCAFWFAPWSAGRKSLPWLVFFLAVLHLLYWASQPVGINNDSQNYVDSFLSVIHGTPRYFPPGYGALLEIVGDLAGATLGLWITLTQHALVVLGAAWLFLLFRKIISEELALLGAILAGALEPSLTVTQCVMSESTTAFAMLGSLYFAIRSIETRKLGFAVVSGFFMGWAGLLRAIPLAALFPALCVVYLFPRMKYGLTTTASVAAFVFLAPILWCGYKSGHPELTNSTGLHLYNRVITEQGLINKDGPSTRRLTELLMGKDLRSAHWIIAEQAGLTNEAADPLFRGVSLEGIARYPLRYLAYTPGLAWSNFVTPTAWVAIWAETIAAFPRFENVPPLAFTASSLAWRWTLEHVNQIVWPILCWLAVAGGLLAFWSRERPVVAAVAWIPTGYLLAGACVEYFNPRYNAAIVPFVAILAMLPFDLLQRHLWKSAFSSEPLSEAQSSSDSASAIGELRVDAPKK
jgi:hypothetical protein